MVIAVFVSFSIMAVPSRSEASLSNVQEQEPKFKYVTGPTEKLFIQRSPSVDKLVSNVTAGVTQGIDTNPLLDSARKIDNYTQEVLDMHFKYPVFGSILGFTNSKFGFDITNINYYRATDVNLFNGTVDAAIEQHIFDKAVLTVGYLFDMMWYPNDRNGTYAGNEINASIRYNMTRWLYQRATYRLLFKDFLSDKARLGNGTRGSDLRFDIRNLFEHELGVYIKRDTKLRIINQFYINESNYQYEDYYDYFNYKVGGSVTHFFNKRLYNISGFYYQRRLYKDRKHPSRESRQKDNLYLVTTSILYDITQSISLYANYSHSENHTNEPADKYVDSIYSVGFYYSF